MNCREVGQLVETRLHRVKMFVTILTTRLTAVLHAKNHCTSDEIDKWHTKKFQRSRTQNVLYHEHGQKCYMRGDLFAVYHRSSLV